MALEHIPVGVFDAAYEEASQMARNDLWRKFLATATNVADELAAEDAQRAQASGRDVPEADLRVISAPTKVDLTADRVDRAVVDNWNEKVLKDLSMGSDTRFYEIGDLVIIDGNLPAGGQPYVEWAKQRPEINPAAEVRMLKKGGAFDPGSIRAQGVQDRTRFSAATRRVSKKKIVY